MTDVISEKPSQEVRQWAMFCHLGGLASIVGIPLLSIIVPLVLWQMKRETHPFIDDQGKEALNFQISMHIYGFALAFLTFILMFVLIGVLLIPVLIGLGIFWLVMTIIGAIKVNEGVAFRYPVTLRLVK